MTLQTYPLELNCVEEEALQKLLHSLREYVSERGLNFDFTAVLKPYKNYPQRLQGTLEMTFQGVSDPEFVKDVLRRGIELGVAQLQEQRGEEGVVHRGVSF